MKILAIDPGNTQSAYVVMDADTFRPLEFGKVGNLELLDKLAAEIMPCDRYVIERVASYGMPVGREVFDTCEWIGRFAQALYDLYGTQVEYVFRSDEKLAICHSSRAGDANIRRALIDRFATHDLKNGKGTKKNPDWFYGFAADIWAAYSVGVTWIDMQKEDIA